MGAPDESMIGSEILQIDVREVNESEWWFVSVSVFTKKVALNQTSEPKYGNVLKLEI
jgi:hypothetical protein